MIHSYREGLFPMLHILFPFLNEPRPSFLRRVASLAVRWMWHKGGVVSVVPKQEDGAIYSGTRRRDTSYSVPVYIKEGEEEY